jgi:hypothetical protein
MALFCPFLAQKRRFLALISALNALEDYGRMQHGWVPAPDCIVRQNSKIPCKVGEAS